MCGRLSLSAADHRAAAELLADAIAEFDATSLAPWLERAGYTPRTNVGPGQRLWLVRDRARRAILDTAMWGMRTRGPSSKLVINARAETVGERPMFRAGFERHRCLIPADGFFEWAKRDDGRQPHWFHRPKREALLLAAVLEPPRGPGEAAHFAIVTRPASPDLEWIHHRMPAIIDPEAVAPWLRGSSAEAHAALTSSPPRLDATPVSRAFNRADYDGPIEA